LRLYLGGLKPEAGPLSHHSAKIFRASVRGFSVSILCLVFSTPGNVPRDHNVQTPDVNIKCRQKYELKVLPTQPIFAFCLWIAASYMIGKTEIWRKSSHTDLPIMPSTAWRHN